MAEDGVHIDLGELGQELKSLDREFATAIRKQVRTAVSEAGAAVLGQARSNASWSSRIPAATKLTTSYSAKRAGITIRTSKTRAPHARPFEFGNKNTYAEARVKELGTRTIRLLNGREVTYVRRRKAMAQMRAKGEHGRGLRHPVFDAETPPTRVTEVGTRPYLFPAVASREAGTTAAFQAAIDKAVREAGFH